MFMIFILWQIHIMAVARTVTVLSTIQMEYRRLSLPYSALDPITQVRERSPLTSISANEALRYRLPEDHRRHNLAV